MTDMTDEQPIDVSRIKPIGTHILVRKCVAKKPELIEVPDQYLEHSEFVEILAVGAKCKHFNQSHVGATVQCPEMAEGMHPLVSGSSEYWMVKESVLDPVVFE